MKNNSQDKIILLVGLSIKKVTMKCITQKKDIFITKSDLQ